MFSKYKNGLNHESLIWPRYILLCLSKICILYLKYFYFAYIQIKSMHNALIHSSAANSEFAIQTRF